MIQNCWQSRTAVCLQWRLTPYQTEGEQTRGLCSPIQTSEGSIYRCTKSRGNTRFSPSFIVAFSGYRLGCWIGPQHLRYYYTAMFRQQNLTWTSMWTRVSSLHLAQLALHWWILPSEQGIIFLDRATWVSWFLLDEEGPKNNWWKCDNHRV